MTKKSKGAEADSLSVSKQKQQFLQSAPFPQMIQHLATAVQEAQVELDRHGVACFLEMADPRRGIPIANRQHALTELGLSPSFLHFQSTEMEARVSIDIRRSPAKLEKNVDVPDPSSLADGFTGASATPVDSAVASKYSYPPGDSSSVHFRLTSVPAPVGLQDALAKLRDPVKGS